MGNNQKITLIIRNEYHEQETYKADLSEPLEYYLKKFADFIKMDFSSLIFLYNGDSLTEESLKNKISEIINSINKKDKRMTILVYTKVSDDISEKANASNDISEKDKIILIVSIESVKIVKLVGNKEDTINNIIIYSSLIAFDSRWCIIKYKQKEIDSNKKFDDIANDEDKPKKLIELTLNYKIPLLVNYLNEDNEKYTIPCLLQDKVSSNFESYFTQNELDKDYYHIYYENKKIEYYSHEIFYELISEDLIQNFFSGEKINNFKKSIVLNDNDDKVKTKTKMVNDKEKIVDTTVSFFQSNETVERKLEIELRVIKKCCMIRFKIKSAKCCEPLKVCLTEKCMILFFIIICLGVLSLPFILTFIL